MDMISMSTLTILSLNYIFRKRINLKLKKYA